LTAGTTPYGPFAEGMGRPFLDACTVEYSPTGFTRPHGFVSLDLKSVNASFSAWYLVCADTAVVFPFYEGVSHSKHEIFGFFDDFWRYTEFGVIFVSPGTSSGRRRLGCRLGHILHFPLPFIHRLSSTSSTTPSPPLRWRRRRCFNTRHRDLRNKVGRSGIQGRRDSLGSGR
jgi:hypothetical protein